MTSFIDPLQHNSTYHMSFKDLAKAKRNTLQIYATPQRYDIYKRTVALSAELYQNDLTIYHDSVSERHERNKQEIKKLIQLLKTNKITPDMLQYNTSNAFYASYVLNHHYSQFLKLATGLAEYSQQLRNVIKSLQNFGILGAIFEKTISTEFKKQSKTTLQNGVIKMAPNTYYYSFKTSPYIHIACFELKQNNKNQYIFVQLRDENGEFAKGVEVRDMGATLSPDYLSVGYRFDNVKPFCVVETSSGSLFRNAVSDDAVTELGYSLGDLAHSVYVTVRYTTMRLQFTTIQKSKQERPLVQYQAVSSRIADGLSTLFGLSFLRQRLITMPQVATFMRYYLSFIHQLILQRLIDLRECCGGFGYMQISGHPGFLQRVSLRAAQPGLTFIPDNKQIMKRLHYYSSDQTRAPEYIKEISAQGNTMEDIFYYFVLICIGMKQNKDKLGSAPYMKQFLRQSCIQMMYNSTYFDPMDPLNPSEHLLPYIIIKYVLNFFKFLSPSALKMEPEKLHELLVQKQTELLEKITQKIPQLTEILEVGYLRNIIIGETDSNAFYTKVMQAAEKNRRNSPQYKEILKPVITLIKEQRASL